MAAPLVRLHDLAHERKDPRRNAFGEQSLAKLVQFGQRFTAQVTGSSCQQVLEPIRPSRYRIEASMTPNTSPIALACAGCGHWRGRWQ